MFLRLHSWWPYLSINQPQEIYSSVIEVTQIPTSSQGLTCELQILISNVSQLYIPIRPQASPTHHVQTNPSFVPAPLPNLAHGAIILWITQAWKVGVILASSFSLAYYIHLPRSSLLNRLKFISLQPSWPLWLLPLSLRLLNIITLLSTSHQFYSFPLNPPPYHQNDILLFKSDYITSPQNPWMAPQYLQGNSRTLLHSM